MSYYYFPDMVELSERAFEARLERYIQEIRAENPACSWSDAESKALWRITIEEMGDRV